MITYIKGDATKPIGEGEKLILHVCNDIGRWGKGFVVAISKKWKKPEQIYRRNKKDLGLVEVVRVESDIYVINMIAQRGIGREWMTKTYLDYEALKECLKKVNVWIDKKKEDYTIHMPRIGCGLGGGEWGRVEEIIIEILNDKEIYVYDL